MPTARALLSVAAPVALVLALGACGGSSDRGPQRSPRSAPRPVDVGTVRALAPGAYRDDLAHGARIERDPATGAFAVASTAPARPRALVVTVHGHSGNAFAQYRLWRPYAASRYLGLVAVEWQTRWGPGARFLDARETYAMIRRAVRRAGVRPGRVLLHGFSKGSKEAFDLTSLDRAQGRLFALTVAESGAPRDATAPDPTLAGTSWVLYCGGRDQWPRISGCPAMRRAKAFLLRSRARIGRFLVDPAARHGGFLLNRRDVERALADFATARR